MTASYIGYRVWRIATEELVSRFWNCPVCGLPVESSNHCPKCGACRPGGCGTDHHFDDYDDDPVFEEWWDGLGLPDDEDDQDDLSEPEGREKGVSRG